MNKYELAAAIAEKTGTTKKNAEEMIGLVFEEIANKLAVGEKVQVSGFGVFEVRNREARVGRNPHTKQSVEIPATRVPAFKASKLLKEKVR